VDLPDKQLGDVHEAIIVRDDADANLGPLGAKNITAMSLAGHESRLGFF
jgi:hypothetical protein